MTVKYLPLLDVTLRNGDVLIVRADGSYSIFYDSLKEIEFTPVYDDLEAEWPEIQRQQREARMHTSMANVGKAFRNFAGLVTAMGEGLREGVTVRELDESDPHFEPGVLQLLKDD